MADKRLKPKKKNTKSYDNKLITWISVGLGAFVAVVIAIVLIITMTTGYIAKVDGLKIYDYEYTYFLQQAMYDIAKEIGIDPKALFTSMYQVLIAKDRGPRLASFMKIIGKDKLNKLLENY